MSTWETDQSLSDRGRGGAISKGFRVAGKDSPKGHNQMDENRITAAILTLALWNSREKTTAKQIVENDWQHVVTDYTNIVAELYGMDRRTRS
jgi:hypothetical protein